MPVVDVVTVSLSSNILSIRSIMLLVKQKIVEVETLFYLSTSANTVSFSFQEVKLL
jgi:hypothetical protein